jgi:hypothetical protein
MMREGGDKRRYCDRYAPPVRLAYGVATTEHGKRVRAAAREALLELAVHPDVAGNSRGKQW